MQDPQYYGLGESRFQTSMTGAKMGDPYYYGLAEAPNMLGGSNQPWFMQSKNQPSWMNQNTQPLSTQQNNPYQINNLGYTVDMNGNPLAVPGSRQALGYASGPEGQHMYDLGFGIDANGNRVANLGNEPIVSSADYQGRKFANELGMVNQVSSMIPCIVVCAAVSGAVAYAVSTFKK